MGIERLGTRDIIGRFFVALQAIAQKSWIQKLGAQMPSDQETETYAWLGQVPQMQEWIGQRKAKGLSAFEYSIRNKEFESTIEILLKHMRRDKTGQVDARLGQLAQRAGDHWHKLLSALIVAGEATNCYDSQYFFDTDHSEGKSGTQDNDLSKAIVLSTAPTAAEFEAAILDAIQALLAFKDDVGEPFNDGASEFVVMVPPVFLASALAACRNKTIVSGSAAVDNTLANTDAFSVTPVVNSRLTSWTTKFVTFRSDGVFKPFILQEEVPLGMRVALGPESEHCQKNGKCMYGVDATRNAGYGMWQGAVLTTFTTA